MLMHDEDIDIGTNIYANTQAAIARTATRGLALYFSRPVRLFRPSKISGWQSLRNVASDGKSEFGTTFLTALVKREGLTVIPKHFIPPMIVNAALGTVLWTTYSEVYDRVHPIIPEHLTTAAALSGAAAGGAQAILAAPAENVRLLLEGGKISGSWSNAWKEVFLGTSRNLSTSKSQQREDIRQVRAWMHEVHDMAGNGWKGWSWGLGKDCCGFAAFFAIFDFTRRIALHLRTQTETTYLSHAQLERHPNFPRTVHAITLIVGGVTGGLAYEIVSRPWDIARRVATLERVTHHHTSIIASLGHKLRDDGILSFFRDPVRHVDHAQRSRFHHRIVGAVRTLARVGPWGAGFLVYEMFGPGIS